MERVASWSERSELFSCVAEMVPDFNKNGIFLNTAWTLRRCEWDWTSWCISASWCLIWIVDLLGWFLTVSKCRRDTGFVGAWGFLFLDYLQDFFVLFLKQVINAAESHASWALLGWIRHKDVGSFTLSGDWRVAACWLERGGSSVWRIHLWDLASLERIFLKH